MTHMFDNKEQFNQLHFDRVWFQRKINCVATLVVHAYKRIIIDFLTKYCMLKYTLICHSLQTHHSGKEQYTEG